MNWPKVMEFSPDDFLSLLRVRRGHFLLESGHHGDLWLDLELLCRYPKRVRPLCAALAKRLQPFEIDAVCGPLVEGAFLALILAAELDLTFAYSERFTKATKHGLFPAGYRVPNSLRHAVRGRRIAIVNDVINAGSAVRGTFEDLKGCSADIIVIGSLLTLGNAAQEFADAEHVALESLAHLPNDVWVPAACPLCAAGMPAEDTAGFATH